MYSGRGKVAADTNSQSRGKYIRQNVLLYGRCQQLTIRQSVRCRWKWRCNFYSMISHCSVCLFYPQKRPKNGSLNRDLLNFLNRYGIFWVPPGESSCPDGSEYVWQRGVGSLQGRVTAAWSWPLFREKKNRLRRCYEKPPGRNFDFRAKSSWEVLFMYIKKILSGGFCSKVKIVTAQLFVTPPKVIFFLLK